MLDVLEDCTSLWGRADVLDHLPQIRCVEGALYAPWSGGSNWGIFDSSGGPIPEALTLRTVDFIPSGPQSTFDRERFKSVPLIRGTFIYLGLINPHFGHFIINSLSRFWPLLFGRHHLPRMICHKMTDDPGYAEYEFISTIFQALSIELNDLEVFLEPVRLERVLVPAPSCFEQYFAYPAFSKLAQYIGRQFYMTDEVDNVSVPLFLSKTQMERGVGRFQGEYIIEEMLRKSGFHIVYPEQLAFKEQVRLLSAHRLILSTSGSSLHTSLFAAKRRHIISVNPTRDVNSNFVLVDKLNENTAKYYYARGTTHSSSQAFLTEHCHPNPKAIAEDLLRLADNPQDNHVTARWT